MMAMSKKQSLCFSEFRHLFFFSPMPVGFQYE